MESQLSMCINLILDRFKTAPTVRPLHQYHYKIMIWHYEQHKSSVCFCACYIHEDQMHISVTHGGHFEVMVKVRIVFRCDGYGKQLGNVLYL